MTRDQWAAKVADVVIEIAHDAAVETVAASQGHSGYSQELARKKLRQELIYVLSELPE